VGGIGFAPAGKQRWSNVGDLSEFTLPTRLFLRSYAWRRVEPVPWSPLRKPLSDCRVALASTAGFVQADQAPFDASRRGGDTSFRVISGDVEVSTLVESHRSRSFDHQGIRSDPNLAFPLDRLRELVGSGRVGSFNHRHFSFMGSITAPGRLIKHAAPEAAELLVEDGVDVTLLVPV
jgi:D-proline reductase (dithiol) PrdB